MTIMLIGNKCDDEDKRAVTTEVTKSSATLQCCYGI